MALVVGNEIELEIQDVAFGGRGVGRHEGCAVFVPGTLVGENVRVRLTKCRKRFAEAELLEVVESSEHRIEPVCPLAGRCPGCSYQHVAYGEEIRLKQLQFAGLLKRIAGLESVPMKDPVPSPAPLGYRNKLVLHAQRERKLGYYGEDNRSVIDVTSCPLAVDPINVELQSVRENRRFMKQLRPDAAVTFRWTETDGAMHWVDRNSGSERLTESTALGDLRVPPRAFFQVNPGAGALLLEQVCAIIDARSPSYLLDFYCGIGLFSLAGAQRGVPHVLGVERQSAAIRAAKQNAKAMGLTADFIAADVEVVGRDALDQVDVAEAMVIADPPRQGLDQAVLDALVEKSPATIVYVSCAPDTLARDLKVLTQESYEVESAQLIDMFPRTSHFESVTVLRCKA
jgi:23S rRNA (uracil1939-C5)-methyltransferase